MLHTVADRWPLSLPYTTAATVALATLLATGWQAVQWRAALVPSDAGSTRDAATVADDASGAHLPSILSAHLFGDGGEIAGPGVDQQALPASTAGYTLRAALSPGGAVIETGPEDAGWYATGATLPGGAVLREVARDHVIIERAGVRERLGFPAPGAAEPASAPAPEPSAAAPVEAAPAAAPGVEAVRTEPLPADVSAEERARLVRQRLEELRNRSRQ